MLVSVTVCVSTAALGYLQEGFYVHFLLLLACSSLDRCFGMQRRTRVTVLLQVCVVPLAVCFGQSAAWRRRNPSDEIELDFVSLVHACGIVGLRRC